MCAICARILYSIVHDNNGLWYFVGTKGTLYIYATFVFTKAAHNIQKSFIPLQFEMDVSGHNSLFAERILLCHRITCMKTHEYRL